MDRRAYEIALEQAKAELHELAELSERLRVRKGVVENAISALQIVLENSSIEPALEVSDRCQSPAGEEIPNSTKEMIVMALKRAGGPLTVPQIVEQIRLSGVSSLPNRDAVRVLMVRRKESFKVLGRGLYALCEDLGSNAQRANVEGLSCSGDVNSSEGAWRN